MLLMFLLVIVVNTITNLSILRLRLSFVAQCATMGVEGVNIMNQSTTTTIRLDKKEKLAFEQLADFEGKKLSTLIKEKMWKAYEDYVDIKTYKEAYTEYLKDPKTISHEEIMKEFAPDAKNVL